ncbi:hypothetical protein AB0H18_20665 [Streptomyces sp. NPDC020766]|uniref:hypothetical protein n=1 Tax=Streptomyces sp. NPDC020766 TaxID=3155011 RepID=UPI00340FF647
MSTPPAEGVATDDTVKAADVPTQTLGVVRPAPTTGSTWPPEFLRREDHFGVIVADALPLVRPYVIQQEQERERQRQRDRRTAATLATLGIDFHGATA